MRGLLPLLTAVVALGAAPAARAAGFTRTELLRTTYEQPAPAPVAVELDGDPQAERVGVDVTDPLAKRAYVEDTCAGSVRRLPLGRADELHAVRLLSWRHDAVRDRFTRYRTSTRRIRAAGR